MNLVQVACQTLYRWTWLTQDGIYELRLDQPHELYRLTWTLPVQFSIVRHVTPEMLPSLLAGGREVLALYLAKPLSYPGFTGQEWLQFLDQFRSIIPMHIMTSQTIWSLKLHAHRGTTAFAVQCWEPGFWTYVPRFLSTGDQAIASWISAMEDPLAVITASVLSPVIRS